MVLRTSYPRCPVLSTYNYLKLIPSFGGALLVMLNHGNTPKGGGVASFRVVKRRPTDPRHGIGEMQVGIVRPVMSHLRHHTLTMMTKTTRSFIIYREVAVSVPAELCQFRRE